ncbi:MAG: AAA family ATPase [Sandaracinaceae bacterium]
MAIKFGVAGTHSTGKSTLVDALDEALTKCGFRVGRVGDLATEARDLGFPILHEHTFESTLWIMTRGISEQLAQGLQNHIVLVDRPALDAIGYLWAALKHREENMPKEQEEYLIALAAHDAATYHVLCKTEIDPSVPLGAGRDTDLDFRAAASEQITSVFSRMSVSPRTVVDDPAFVQQIATELEDAARGGG